MFFKELSGRVVLFLLFVFALVFGEKIQTVLRGERTCVCSYDGFGYYMYNASLFGEGTLYMQPEWAQGLQNEYCNGIEAYQLVKQNYPNHLDVYHMGMAYLQLPAYLISDGIARISGHKTDGFSTPYQLGFLLNALLFIFLGLLYLRKLLRLFFSDRLTAALIIIGFGATNTYITFTHQYDLPHLYLFFLNAAFAYYLIRFVREQKNKHLIFAALLLGITVSIRPTQALLGLLPLFLPWKEHRFTRDFWRRILIFPLMGLLWNIPQMLYWLIVGGELFIFNLHMEDIVLSDPNLIDFLFSYRKGWLLYSPIFLLLIPAFIVLYQKNRTLFWGLFSTTFIYIYVMSAWECWWYASSFGSRVMVDLYPLLLIVLGFLLLHLKSLWTKIAIGAFVGFCFLLNVLQSYQFERLYLHGSRMSKQQYWYIFGKTTIDDLTNVHLLIDREELTWVKREYPQDQYEVRKKKIFELDQPMRSVPGRDLTIGRLNLYELLDTDETQLMVRILVKASDTTQSSLLRMETVSKYNCYSWDHLEVSQGTSSDGYTELHLRFNLPDIRHTKDQLQMYLDNDAPVSVEIKEMSIDAFSLIRK